MLEKLDPRKPELPGLEAEEQDVSFFENLPYSDFRRWVPENSIYEKALTQIPALGRLNAVKALSFLSYVGPKPEEMYFTEFTHSRLDHTLTVALITEAILRQNGISQNQINLGIIASLLHDIATPAHGDATKQVDIKNLHEEDNWWEVLEKKGKNFITQFGTKQMIDKIIKNQGMLGKVLDISDRITYTMKDLGSIQSTFPLNDLGSNSYLTEINTIIANNPKIGNIYQEIGVDQKKQDVFFNNVDNLNVFLNLRAHLHKNLYLYPTNQAKDLFITKIISRFYSEDGSKILSPEKLRKMTDYDLIQILSDHFSEHTIGTLPLLVNWNPKFKKFDSMNKAKKKEEELQQKNDIVVVGIKECKGFDPATNYKIADDNRYIEFRKHNPSAATKIENIAQSTKGIFVFWTNVSESSPTNNLLKAVLQKKDF